MSADRARVGMHGTLRRSEPMSRHTTWRVGGSADELYIPDDIGALADFLAQLPPQQPLTWIGLGSNVLVRDGGIRGTVILSTHLKQLTVLDGGRVAAEAGVPSAKVARASVKAGLSGAEFLAGIPGTVGGALAMNAGAFGGETWRIVGTVETIDRAGRRFHRTPGDFGISYRHVRRPKDEWFVSATFHLEPGVDGQGRVKIRDLLTRRGATQPTRWPNAGSVFRNPPGDHAARLIETAVLKGLREGNASVSTLHANFIVNDGGARAADIETLIMRVQERVLAVHGVLLEPEVQILGEL